MTRRPCPRFAISFLLLLLTGALSDLPADAQSAKSQKEPPQCAFQRKEHPDYVMWICNPDGSAYAVDGLVLWMRTNEAGARVTSPVWSGPAMELATRGEAIIEAHRVSQARCVHYFHVAQARPRSAGWNVVPESMRAWLSSGASSRMPQFCYTADPGAADLVLVWGGPSDQLPNAFSVDIPWEASKDASPVPAATRTDAAATSAPDPAELKLAAYDIRSGMDDTVIRLGLSVYATEDRGTPGTRADWGLTLETALQALAVRPKP